MAGLPARAASRLRPRRAPRHVRMCHGCVSRAAARLRAARLLRERLRHCVCLPLPLPCVTHPPPVPSLCCAALTVLCAQNGYTPLHLAALCGHASVVTLLCERGANKEAKNNVRPRHTHTSKTKGCITQHERGLPKQLGSGGGHGGAGGARH
jgi:hypothetical protein